MKRNISAVSGVFVFSSTIIGAGILALPVAASSSGFFPLFTVLLLMAAVSVLSAMYIAEAVLSTNAHPHLPSLAREYLGNWGMAAMLLGTMIYIYGALVGYLTVGGQVLFSLSGGRIPVWGGIVIYFALGAVIIHFGLKVVSYVETYLFYAMILLLGSIIMIAFPGIKLSLLASAHWMSTLDSFGVVLFAYVGHSVIPSVANGLQNRKDIVRVAVWGVTIPWLLYSLWSIVILGIVPAAGDTGYSLAEAGRAGQPATLPLGYVVGGSVIVLGNLFAVLSTMTSYIGFGFSLKDEYANVADTCNRTSPAVLLTALVVLPPLLIALLRPSAFISALEIAGTYGGGVFVGILPVLIVFQIRKRGRRNKQQRWNQFVAPTLVLLVYLAGIVYTTIRLLIQ